MATNNDDFKDFEDDAEQNEQELDQTDEDKRKRYFSKECKLKLIIKNTNINIILIFFLILN